MPSYSNYAQGLDKTYGFLGTHGYFQATRTRHLDRLVKELEHARGRLSIMEIGVGLGVSLRSLPKKHMAMGLEPDVNLLAQADGKAGLKLVHATGPHIPFADSTFDLIYMINVLHHMKPDTIEKTLCEVNRALKPGGKVAVFEHNAYNLPICFFLKTFVTIDRDAHFLMPASTRRLLYRAGLLPERLMYICFFPRFLAFLQGAERYLSWLPLGGGYCLSAGKE